MASAKRPKAEIQKTGQGDWIDVMHINVGEYVNVETEEGCHRGGRMTSIRCREIVLNGTKVNIPVELELNGDPTDTVSMSRIIKLDFPGPG